MVKNYTENKFEMEIIMDNDLEILYTTIPDIEDINWVLEHVAQEEEFDLSDITDIKIYPLNK